jgi:uncharacterized C2H2 Zn-finger protein
MTNDTTNKELERMCKDIAQELSAIADGELYRCPACGEIAKANEVELEDGEILRNCPHCAAVMDEDEHRASMCDYFENVLDIEYRINSRGEYVGVVLAVALGGPGVYVDTREQEVKGYWGGSRAGWTFDNDIAAAIDDVFEEYYQNLR